MSKSSKSKKDHLFIKDKTQNDLTFRKSIGIQDNDVWDVVNSYFDEYGLLSHQIQTFNEFISTAIPDIIERDKIIEVEGSGQKYTVEFGEVVFQRPKHKEINGEIRDITPNECTDRDITYQSQLFVDIQYTNTFGDVKILKNMHIGSIPIEVRSDLCNLSLPENGHNKETLAKLKEDFYDEGGYFIVKGAQKVIAPQERPAKNKSFVLRNRKSTPKFELYTEVRSCSGSHSTTVQVGLLKKNISVLIPYIEITAIPLGVLFRALGVDDEKDQARDC